MFVAGNGRLIRCPPQLVAPVEQPDPLLHHRWVSMPVDRQVGHIAKVELRTFPAQDLLSPFLSLVDPLKNPAFLLHILWRADPAIMIDIGVYPGDLQLKSAFFLPVVDPVEAGDPPE